MPSRTVDQVTDRDELIAFFRDDPRVHIYALADLEEPYWSASMWWRSGDGVVGFVGLPGGADPVVYAVSSRDPDGTVELLAELSGAIAPGGLITAPIGAGARLGELRTLLWNRTYHRYHLPDLSTLPSGDPEVVPLGPDDVEEIEALYDTDPGTSFFMPAMLESESFVGIREGGELVAVAGTHVLSEAQGVAAIGGVVTHPDHRGRGYGSRVTVGVCRLLEGRVEVIGLNTADANAAARAVYRRLGFVPVLRYEEAQLA